MRMSKHFVAALKHHRGSKSEHFPKIGSHRAKKTHGHDMHHTFGHKFVEVTNLLSAYCLSQKALALVGS